MYESKQSSNTTSSPQATQHFSSNTTLENTNVSEHAEHFPISISQNQTYYRSRVYSATTGINPLTTSAETLLSLATYLQTLAPNFAKIPNLIQYLIHEIHVFETQAQAKGYNQKTIQASRYILCATLDEILLTNVWRHKQSSPDKQRLLTYFEDEKDNGEHFFSILSRVRQNPQRYIHLLELIYVCLSLGFEGKYRNMPRGKQQLDNIIDALYQEISQQQNEPIILFPEKKLTYPASVEKKSSTKKQLLSLNLMLISAGTLLMTLYAGFSYMLGIRMTPIANILSTIMNSH